MAWHHRIRNVLRPGRHGREIDREMEFHLAERRDQLIAAGMDPARAAREAELRFGNRLLQSDRTRDADVAVWLESLLADLRYAWRGMRRNPGFAAVAILSLALGIGANTAIFSLTNALLLRALPVVDPESLVKVTFGERGSDAFTYPLWEAIRDRQSVFSSAFAYTDQRFNIAPAGPVRHAPGALASGGFFSTLGVRPVAGRLLTPGDDVRGCPAIAVVSAGFAARELGGDAAAVGRVVSLDGHPFSVVGVVDPAFTGIQVGSVADIYAPFCTLPVLQDDPQVLERRSMWYLQIFGRLADGVTATQAGAQMRAIAPAVFEATVPEKWAAADQQEYRTSTLSVAPGARGLSGLRDAYGRALLVLTGIVALVLLVACANIANLQLARAAARQEESALRRALGAGRARVVRQLLTESLLLSLLGAAAGLVFAHWASALLVRFVADRDQAAWLDLSLDGRVLGFTLLVATVTGLLFGLAPARLASRAVPATTARGGKGGLADGGSQRRAGKALVVGQVALSMVLVAAAALLVGSFRRLATVDPGFRARGVLVVDAEFAATGLDGTKLWVVQNELLDAFRAQPEVDSASASWTTPVGRRSWNDLIVVEGYTPPSFADGLASFNAVADGYFATLGTPLQAGRDLTGADRAGAPRVAVVNQAFARRFFGGRPALGATFATKLADGTSDPIEVVGVVGDAKYGSLDQEPPPTVYQPIGQVPDMGSTLAFELRSSAPRAALVAAVRRTLAETAPLVSFELTPFDQQLAGTLARPRLLATLSGFFGGVALLLAVIGLYGTLSYAVTRRRGEIGLRMALGAASRQVLGMVVSEAGRLVATGVALGILLTLLAARSLAAFVYGVTATDPATLAAAAGGLALSALAAALLPALRATRVQPSEVLRE